MANFSNKAGKDMLLLLLISLLMNAGLFFLDEGNHSFGFLYKPREIVHLITFTIFFGLFPIAIYNFAAESKYRKKAFAISMIGYAPFIFLLCLLIFHLLK